VRVADAVVFSSRTPVDFGFNGRVGSSCNSFRVAYYLGNCLNLLKCNPAGKDESTERIFVSKQYDNVVDVSASMSLEGWTGVESLYIGHVVSLLQEVQSTSTVPVLCQDNRRTPFEPLIVKSRAVGSPNATLLKLNQQRHWLDIDKVYADDCSFQNKKNAAVWRGASTGYWGESTIADVRSQRYNLFVNWSGARSNLLDLGLSLECQHLYQKLSQREAGLMKVYFKRPKLTRAQMLQYKYIISLEGNDVSSGLKWILASASVPIMPAPRAESWLMEGILKPWIHFAPIKSDTSDLLDVIDILQANPELAEEIALNGKRFIEMFLDFSNERQLGCKVLQELIKRIG